MYCKIGEKARVNYNFNNIKRTYETDKTPISISAYQQRINATENFKNEGFGIRFYSPNNRTWIEAPVHDYIIFPVPDFDYGVNYEGISTWNCGNFDFNRNSDGSYAGAGVDITTISILPNLKCPKLLTTTDRCSIEIKSNGIIIFQDQGECPCNFQVTCGDCPEGTIRCEQSGYPGYCCLPCQPIAQRINNLAARL